MIYCVIPRELAPKLHETLRRHFADDPQVEVVVERRALDRRRRSDRRGGEAPERDEERRRIRNVTGRRVADRRVTVVEVEPPALPRRARAHADRIQFVERAEPSTERAEDLDTARLVTRIQGGDREGFGDLYLRYFDRVYAYLNLALGDPHEAEDLTQQVFVKALEALPGYERRSRVPFRGWLFTIVRHTALTTLDRRNRTEVLPPETLNRQLESGSAHADLQALGWVSDRELILLMERLPLAQRQVLMLRYMLDLSHGEIAKILGRSSEDVRIQAHRALRFLEQRLRALGRTSTMGAREPSRARPRHAYVLRSRRYALALGRGR
jgi:RNA polymerase sigma-70 factor (ECF subfamily)